MPGYFLLSAANWKLCRDLGQFEAVRSELFLVHPLSPSSKPEEFYQRAVSLAALQLILSPNPWVCQAQPVFLPQCCFWSHQMSPRERSFQGWFKFGLPISALGPVFPHGLASLPLPSERFLHTHSLSSCSLWEDGLRHLICHCQEGNPAHHLPLRD